jgi:autotransporter-associated beta strand protein
VDVSGGAALNLGVSQTLAGLSGAGSVGLGTSNLTLNNASANVFSGQFTGTGDLVKLGAGTLTLSGSSSFTGNVAVREGSLVAAAAGSLGDGAAAVRVGNTAAISGTTALLLQGLGINRAVIVEQNPAGAPSRPVILGGVGSGTASFGTGMIQLGREVILQADTGSKVQFANTWKDFAGTGTPTAAIQIGNTGKAGVVEVLNNLATTGTVSVVSGSLLMGQNGGFGAGSTVVVGSAGSSSVSLDLRGLNAFTFANGQTLMGQGTMLMSGNMNVNMQGTFSPGNSPGVFTFDGAGTVNLAGTTRMDVWGTDRGTGYDGVDLANGAQLAFGGDLVLDFSSTELPFYTSYQLFGDGSGQGLSGNFATVVVAPGNEFYSGLTFVQPSANPNIWLTGKNAQGQMLQFTAATGEMIVVPEPGAVATAVIGVAAVAFSAWRRKKARSRARAA